MNITLKRISLALLLLAAARLGAQDFRNATWGMSLEQVVELEGGGAVIGTPSIPGILQITYQQPFLEEPAQIAFLFSDGQLSSGEIRVAGDMRPAFQKRLEAKYGAGSYWEKYDTWNWSDDRTVLSLSYLQGRTVLSYLSR